MLAALTWFGLLLDSDLDLDSFFVANLEWNVLVSTDFLA